MPIAKCEVLAEKYPNAVILQLRGKFYNAFDESAIVLSSIMGYKLNDTGAGRFKAGFPISSVEKVITQFKSNHIDFYIFDNDKLINKIEFEDNRYKDFCKTTIKPKASDKKVDTDKKKNDKGTVAIRDIEDDCQALSFLEKICDGKDPFTGDRIDVLDLNDVRVLRTLYKLRDIVRNSIMQ